MYIGSQIQIRFYSYRTCEIHHVVYTSTGGSIKDEDKQRGHYSLCYTNSDRHTGQSEADQQHAQEEEVGAGRSERTCGWTAVIN